MLVGMQPFLADSFNFRATEIGRVMAKFCFSTKIALLLLFDAGAGWGGGGARRWGLKRPPQGQFWVEKYLT